MRVVVIGAGKIGGGYLLPLFEGAGWHVTLAARDEPAAARIAAAREIEIRVSTSHHVQLLGPPQTVPIGSPGFEEAVAAADLIATSVGVGNVAALAVPLARALDRREIDRPIDVWLVENADLASELERLVAAVAAEHALRLPPTRFAGAIAKVAVARGRFDGTPRPTFVGDAFRSLLVDATRVGRGVPELPGVEGTDAYRARLAEKMYVFNAGHALCAYLGALRGHATISAAVTDPVLRPLVVGCLLDARAAVVAAWPSLGADRWGPVAEALARYADGVLADPVPRVARDPIRKLGPEDRLLGTLRLVRDTLGRLSPHLCLAIAAALLYRHPEDEEATQLRDLLTSRGLAHVLATVSHIDPSSEIGVAIARRYRGFILTRDGAVLPPVHDAMGVSERQTAAPISLLEPTR